MKKRGDIGLSFNVIFSIIIIVVILAVAFYVISSFWGLSKCSQVGLFYDDLKDYINKAWQSTMHKETFKGELPSGIESVCFGLLSQNSNAKDRDMRTELSKRYINSKKNNVFLYPPNKACDGELGSIKLEHIETQSFFCVPVNDGKIQLLTETDQFSSLVKLSAK